MADCSGERSWLPPGWVRTAAGTRCAFLVTLKTKVQGVLSHPWKVEGSRSLITGEQRGHMGRADLQRLPAAFIEKDFEAALGTHGTESCHWLVTSV